MSSKDHVCSVFADLDGYCAYPLDVDISCALYTSPKKLLLLCIDEWSEHLLACSDSTQWLYCPLLLVPTQVVILQREGLDSPLDGPKIQDVDITDLREHPLTGTH